MTTAAKSHPETPSAVEALVIRDCNFSFRGFFTPPRPFISLDLKELSNKLLAELKEFNVTAGDISLDRGDSLFAYSVKIQLFNGLISFTATSSTLDANFTRLLRVADRKLAADSLRKMVDMFRDHLADFCFFDINLHAEFSSQAKRDEFFSRRGQPGCEVAGVLGYKKLDDPNQMIRIEIDQSWAFTDAAFIAWRTVGMKLPQLFSTDPIWSRFFALLTPFELSLQDD